MAFSVSLIWHVAPEAAIGGLLALVQSGDRICLDAVARRLELLVSDNELAPGAGQRYNCLSPRQRGAIVNYFMTMWHRRRVALILIFYKVSIQPMLTRGCDGVCGLCRI